MKIIQETKNSLRYYMGFNARAAQPMFTRHHWAATEFQSMREAEACVRQLSLLEVTGLRIVNGDKNDSTGV